jgi:hypothetical protein
MKTHNCRSLAFVCFAVTLLLSACEHDVTTGSTVYPDGSIDRTIVFPKSDSTLVVGNMMGISEAMGWDVVMTPLPKGETKKDKKQAYDITFKKHFASFQDANNEMDREVDTLFHIQSAFEKQNRWFYTYIEYRDTYRALNRFNAVRMEDYFTREDFAFIDRLPPEGKAINHADSIYLARLTEKIYEVYGSRTIFEELFDHLVTSMQEHQVASRWQDSLIAKKKVIYQHMLNESLPDNDGLLSVTDQLKIPIPEAGRKAILEKTAEFEKRLDFVSKASSGKYVHKISMPWAVVESNADSVNNNELYWHPPMVKFLLKDYTMTARSRKLNAWAVGISGVMVLATLALLMVGRKGKMAERLKG